MEMELKLKIVEQTQNNNIPYQIKLIKAKLSKMQGLHIQTIRIQLSQIIHIKTIDIQ
jgi:hypothetical protein